MDTSSKKNIPATSPSRTYRLTLAALILLNFAKAAVIIGGGQPFPESDGVNYWKMGIEITQGDWMLRGRSWAFRPPAFPYYLAAMQTIFGNYAIIAATVFQVLSDFMVALITAWICARVTRNRWGAVVGLALSFCCLSRSCFMIFLLADNLLCVTLVLYFAAFVAWLGRPSWWAAAAMGIFLAISALLKPVASPLWFPTIGIMGYHLWKSSQFNRIWAHAAIMLVLMGGLLAPWYVRNKIIFGHYFLTQFTGRALWSGCHGRPSQMPVDDSDGPKNQALKAALGGVDMDMGSEWNISRALQQRGYSDYDADVVMAKAEIESIREHPFQYLSGRGLRFTWFWVSPKPWLDVPWGWFYSDRELPAGWPTKFKDKHEDYVPPGQVRWSVPILDTVHQTVLRIVWHPNSVFFGLGALAAAIGCVLMLRDPAYRVFGLVITSVILVVSLGTICFVWPQFRYRLPLEPFMIVAVTPYVISICRRIAARKDQPKALASGN
jgi:hypothetical protein